MTKNDGGLARYDHIIVPGHEARVDHDGSFFWECSCGSGKTMFVAYEYALASKRRHLRAMLKAREV